MKPLTFQEALHCMQGTCDRPAPVGSFRRISIDSRAVEPGDLFFAIPGQRFDGHAYVASALTGGAAAAVVRDDFIAPPELLTGEDGDAAKRGTLILRVNDTVAALGRLARYYRRSSIDGSVTVVAVTGSNGKTTTKAMIAHVLTGRWTGRASAKSYNNEIGVPLTLLSVEQADNFVVCEVGTNALGEIASLASLVEPEIAVITGVSEAHLEGLGSLGQIAEEKLSLFHHLRDGGLAVVNADCDVLRRTLQHDRRLAQLKCVTFGQWADADLRLTDLQVETVSNGGDVEGFDAHTFPPIRQVFTVNGRFRYRLGVPGRHNVMNALAAIAVARRFGADHDEIAERLASFSMPPMRLQYERIDDLTLINDAYNANPASVTAALDVLTTMPAPGRRVLILGDMRELGTESERLHRQVAERIGASGVEVVIAIGEHARLVARTAAGSSSGSLETHAYASAQGARRRLASWLKQDDTILMKGSRALALETLVPRIRELARRD